MLWRCEYDRNIHFFGCCLMSVYLHFILFVALMRFKNIPFLIFYIFRFALVYQPQSISICSSYCGRFYLPLPFDSSKRKQNFLFSIPQWLKYDIIQHARKSFFFVFFASKMSNDYYYYLMSIFAFVWLFSFFSFFGTNVDLFSFFKKFPLLKAKNKKKLLMSDFG